MLPEPSDVEQFNVYEWTFIDDLQFIKVPTDVFAYDEPEMVESVTRAVRERFLAAGWEGDGDIGIIWLPPFVDAGWDGNYGTHIWHVKQSNNGISFLACQFPLPFNRLSEQNSWREPMRQGTPINIVECGVSYIRKHVPVLRSQIIESIKQVAGLPPGPTLDYLLAHFQGLLVSVCTF